jgi:hypothetical protein
LKIPGIGFQSGEERIASQRLAAAHPEVDQPGEVVTICAAFDLDGAEMRMRRTGVLWLTCPTAAGAKAAAEAFFRNVLRFKRACS